MWEVEGLVDPTGRYTRGSAVPLVGRRAELRMLNTRFRRAVDRGRCVLVTVTGPAGIGKSRILKEFIAGIETEATVVVGRCLPYGEGITYWPLIEIVNDLAGATGVAEIEDLLSGDSQPQAVASRVAAAAGRAGASATEVDVQWAVRRLFEALARRGPLVAAFDDIHWAEPAMLDLIEHVAAHATGPVLIVCVARGDLLERRPAWATAGGKGSIVRLEPLSDTDSARLLGRLATRRRAKVRRDEVMYAAEGNPLFLEQLVAMRADDPAVRTPPTIQALLAARIDALPVRERRVVEAASIEGRGFHSGAVRALVDQKRTRRRRPRFARRSRAHPARPARVRRRDRLSLHAHPGARRGLRPPGKAAPRRPARGVRRLAARARRSRERGRRDRRLPPRAGPRVQVPARAGRR